MNLIEYVGSPHEHGWEICLPEGVYHTEFIASNSVYYLHFARKIFRSSNSGSYEYSTDLARIKSIVDFPEWEYLTRYSIEYKVLPDLARRLNMSPTDLQYWDLI